MRSRERLDRSALATRIGVIGTIVGLFAVIALPLIGTIVLVASVTLLCWAYWLTR